MRSLEPWVEAPLVDFLRESSAELALIMTASGQVVAQHGFARSLDLMAVAALGSAIIASTGELGRILGSGPLGSVLHQSRARRVFLAGFDMPAGTWIGLVVFGPETTVGLVQVFFARMTEALRGAAPAPAAERRVLADQFEDELNASLRALFGR